MKADDFLADVPSADDFLGEPDARRPRRDRIRNPYVAPDNPASPILPTGGEVVPAVPITDPATGVRRGRGATDYLRDAGAAILKIGPTAARGIGDITQMATGGKFGSGLSGSMTQGMQAIDDVVGSDILRAEKGAVNQTIADPAKDWTDVIASLYQNPGALTDMGVSTVGSMMLPLGVAGIAGKIAPLSAKAATGLAIGTGAVQNAADTFTGTDADLAGKYQAALISGAASAALGKLFGGGLEGQLARRVTGNARTGGAKEIGKSMLKEGGQEFGEEGINPLAQNIGEGKPLDFNQAGKQGTLGGILGVALGGGASTLDTLASNPLQYDATLLARALDADSNSMPARPDVMDNSLRAQPAPVAARPVTPVTPAPIAQLPYDPEVQNPQRPVVVDKQGTARQMTADEFLAADDTRQGEQDMGLTPDVRRAQEARQRGENDAQSAATTTPPIARAQPQEAADGTQAAQAQPQQTQQPAQSQGAVDASPALTSEVRNKWPGLQDKSDEHIQAAEDWSNAERRVKGEFNWSPLGDERVSSIEDATIAEMGGQPGVARDQVGYLKRLTARLNSAADEAQAERSTPGTLANKRQEKEDAKRREESGAAMQKATEQDVEFNLERVRDLRRQGRISNADELRLLDLARSSEDGFDAAMKLEGFVSSKDVPGRSGDVQQTTESANDTPTPPDGAAAPGPAKGQNALTVPQKLQVTFGGKTYPVESVEDAQRKWIKFQETADGGAPVGVSKVGNGVQVTDQDGKFVARARELRGEGMAANDAAIQAVDERIAVVQGSSPQGQFGKIEDFGEKLEGARKDYAASLKDAMSLDVKTVPLSQSWPEPNYQKLIDAGVDPWTVAFVHAARDSVPTKPQKSWKLSKWAADVATVRNFADKLLSGEWKRDALEPFIRAGSMRDAAGAVDLYQLVGHEKSLKGVRVSRGEYSMYRGVEYKPAKVIWTVEQQSKASAFGNWPRELATGDTRQEAIDKFVAKFKAIDLSPKAKVTTFDIWRENGKYKVGKKIGKEYAAFKTFDSVKEAREYKATHQADLEKALEQYKSTPFERKSENLPRVGEDHRGGARVTPEVFADTFGFRGVQFGNYVEDSRRQQDLNDAYDALMDMAAVIGVPPRALSLGGKLGLAFGARGKGGKGAAAAHYESDRAVINLTKGSGAGSLAHEWFHGVDNYFAKMGDGQGGYMTGGARNDAVRPAMAQAFSRVMAAIKSSEMRNRAKALDGRRTKDYWSTDVEMAARSYEAYIIAKLQDQSASNDYLANVVSEDYWKAQEALFGRDDAATYPYPTEKEMGPIRQAFDSFFDTIQTKEDDAGNVTLYSRPGDIGRADATVDTLRTALTKRFGADIARMEARGFLKLWPSTQAFNDGQTSEHIDGPAQGYWDGKVAHLFADGIESGNEVAVLLHEVGEHASMKKMLGPEAYGKLVERAYSLVDANDPTALRAVDRIPDDTPAHYKDSEFLAYMIEEAAADGAKAAPSVRKWLSDIVAAVRAWFSQTGLNRTLEKFGKGIELTPQDIAALAVRAVRWQAGQDGNGKTQEDGGKLARPSNAAAAVANVFGGTPNMPTAQANAAPWAVTDPGRLDDFIRYIQNSRIDIKRTVDAVKAAGQNIADDANPYLQDELYIGKVRAQLDRLADESVKPLLQAIANSGFTPEQVNEYLWARHAEERNRQMAKVNAVPFTQALDLAGMSTTDANAKLASFQAMPEFRKMQAIARMIDQITTDARTKIVTDGLEDAGVIQAWEGAYKHYVPLQRDMEEAGGKASGYNVKGSESRRAVGSKKEAINILANVIAQAEATIIRSEKATVGRSVLDMARQHPNPDFWTVDTPPTERAIDPRTGLVTTRVKANYKSLDNVFTVKEAGVEHFIVFNEDNPRAVQFARTMKNMDAANLGPVMDSIAKVTRYLAQWVTSRNPLFWLTNFARDIQGVAFNLQSTPLKGQAPQVMANIPQALGGFARLNMGKKSGQWTVMAQRFKDAGGQTGYIDQYRDSVERMGDIIKEIEQERQSKADPRKIGRGVLAVLEGANDAIENGVRLAVFNQGIEEGLSDAQAASIAKNISVNFNRKGNATAVYNALYMFMNANIQGNVRMIQGVQQSRRAQVYAGALTLAGAAVALLNLTAGGDDEATRKKRYELVPEWERERNWIVFIHGTDQYIKIPLPLGPHVLFNAGRILAELGLEDGADPMEKAAGFVSSMISAFNPIGGGFPTPDAKGLAQLATPTVARPIVDTVLNQNFAGIPITREGNPWGYNKPAYLDGRENTPSYWTTAAKAMNDWTGGDNVKPGHVNLSPEQLAYLVKGYAVPGIAQTVDKVAGQVMSRKETPMDQIVGVSKFFGSIDDNERRRAGYEVLRNDKQRIGEYQNYIKAGDREKAKETLKKWGGGSEANGRKLLGQYTATDRLLASYRKMKKTADDEKLDQINTRIDRTLAVYQANTKDLRRQ